MGTIRDHMGVALVSSLAELIVGYYNASPSSELLDSASTVGHDLRKKMSENTHKIKKQKPANEHFKIHRSYSFCPVPNLRAITIHFYTMFAKRVKILK